MTPTQAQIEAADRLAVKIVSLVSDAVDREGELGAYEGIECVRKIKEMILALTAAAEVGEQSKMFAYISGQSDGKIAELEAREEYALGHLGSQIEQNEKLRAELAATIERCAQVAEDWFTLAPKYRTKENLLARIRALKDKP